MALPCFEAARHMGGSPSNDGHQKQHGRMERATLLLYIKHWLLFFCFCLFFSCNFLLFSSFHFLKSIYLFPSHHYQWLSLIFEYFKSSAHFFFWHVACDVTIVMTKETIVTIIMLLYWREKICQDRWSTKLKKSSNLYENF